MNWRRHLYLVVAPLIPLSQVRVDQGLGEFRAQEEILYVWSGSHLKRLAAGFEDVMADVYWLRTIQYFGGRRAHAREKRFDLLEPLTDITTTLDPRLEIAYRYGAIFLSESFPVGAGRPEAGMALLRRGAPEVVEGWRLRQLEGYYAFLFLKDARRASDILLEASKMPGAASWLESLAAELLLKGGEREMSRRLWRRMYEQSEDGAMRENAHVHLQVLDALDARDAVAGLVLEFGRRTARWPRSLAELVSLGPGRVRLVDPSGVPFDYDPETGVVNVSRRSNLWRPSEGVK